MVVGDRERFRAAAASQVDAMRRITRFESGAGHAAGVTGIARSLQAVDQNQFAARDALRLLRVDQNSHFRLGLINNGFDRKPALAFRALPEVPGESR